MLQFIVEHKYCKMTKVIQGYNIYDALRLNGLNNNLWIIKGVYK